jgi:hypothetical protein
MVCTTGRRSSSGRTKRVSKRLNGMLSVESRAMLPGLAACGGKDTSVGA